MIYEAVYIAVTRQYENSGAGYVALRYTSDIFLRVVRELFVSCRKSGKKMFLTNITMIARGLLLVIYKYINSY